MRPPEAYLVVIAANISLIQRSIKDDAFIINVHPHSAPMKTFIDWYIDIMRDGFLTILLGLFGTATTGLWASVLAFWHGCFGRRFLMREEMDGGAKDQRRKS